jgi:hypothetical protein
MAVTVKHLGAAKPDSKVFKRGYTVNLTPNPPKKAPAIPAKKKAE